MKSFKYTYYMFTLQAKMGLFTKRAGVESSTMRSSSQHAAGQSATEANKYHGNPKVQMCFFLLTQHLNFVLIVTIVVLIYSLSIRFSKFTLPSPRI